MRIRLELHRTLDVEALAHDQVLLSHRCFAHVRFRTLQRWTDERFAIIDTGDPSSVA